MTKSYCKKDEFGNIRWYKEDDKGYGFFHKEGGPAIEYVDGGKRWYQNGQLHRIDGPASTEINGKKEYFLYGKYYPNIKTDEEWIIFQIIS